MQRQSNYTTNLASDLIINIFDTQEDYENSHDQIDDEKELSAVPVDDAYVAVFNHNNDVDAHRGIVAKYDFSIKSEDWSLSNGKYYATQEINGINTSDHVRIPIRISDNVNINKCLLTVLNHIESISVSANDTILICSDQKLTDTLYIEVEVIRLHNLS